MFISEVCSLIKLPGNKSNYKQLVKMFQVKSFVVCVILVLVWQHSEAGKLTKTRSNKRYDEALQTDIYETVVDDMQADATTVYPPLFEEPSNAVSIKIKNLSDWYIKLC